jgi:hypothetical protein
VRGVRGRGVHYQGRERGKGGAGEKHSTDISIFRALSFPIYFFMSSHPIGPPSDFSLLLSSLGLMLLLIPTLPPPIHPSLLRPLQILDPLPSLLPFPFLTSLSPPYFPTCPRLPSLSLSLSSTEPLLLITTSVSYSRASLRIRGSLTKVKPLTRSPRLSALQFELAPTLTVLYGTLQQ